MSIVWIVPLEVECAGCGKTGILGPHNSGVEHGRALAPPGWWAGAMMDHLGAFGRPFLACSEECAKAVDSSLGRGGVK